MVAAISAGRCTGKHRGSRWPPPRIGPYGVGAAMLAGAVPCSRGVVTQYLTALPAAPSPSVGMRITANSMTATGYCLNLLQACGNFIIERAAQPDYHDVQTSSICTFALTGNNTALDACVRRQGLEAMQSDAADLTYFTLGALACIGSAVLVYGVYRDVGGALWRAWQTRSPQHDAADNV